MSGSSLKSLLPSFLTGFQDLFATRYLTGAGMIILVYDILLAFETELNVIWKTKLNAPKFAYIVYRYGMLATIPVLLIDTFPSSNTSGKWCLTSFTVITVTIFVLDAIGHGLVIFRTFVLWGRNARILRLLFIGSAVINVCSTVFVGLTVRSFYQNSQLELSESLHFCINNAHIELLSGFWASQAIFDIYVLGLVLWNAMDRPRTSNQKILRILYEDRIHLIVITWALRVLNFILCLTGGPDLSSVALSFTESVITTINSRLLLHIFRSETQGGQSREIFNYGTRSNHTSRSESRSSHAPLSLCDTGDDATSRSSSGIRLLPYRCTTDTRV